QNLVSFGWLIHITPGILCALVAVISAILVLFVVGIFVFRRLLVLTLETDKVFALLPDLAWIDLLHDGHLGLAQIGTNNRAIDFLPLGEIEVKGAISRKASTAEPLQVVRPSAARQVPHGAARLRGSSQPVQIVGKARGA